MGRKENQMLEEAISKFNLFGGVIEAKSRLDDFVKRFPNLPLEFRVGMGSEWPEPDSVNVYAVYPNRKTKFILSLDSSGGVSYPLKLFKGYTGLGSDKYKP